MSIRNANLKKIKPQNERTAALVKQLLVGPKIGKYTKYQREKRGFSLNEFAKEIKLTPSFLMRLEKGSYNSVKFDVIEKLANGFRMTIEDFLEKCEIISKVDKLPPIEYLIKEKYQLPPKAIEDIMTFIDFLKVKYKDKIKAQKQAHKEYWKH